MHTPPPKKFRRVVLRVFLFCSLSFTAWNIFQLVTSNGGRLLVSYAKAEISVRLISFTSTSVSQKTIEEKIISEVAEDDRDWIVIESLRVIAKNNGYDLSSELTENLELAYDIDHSILKTTKECGLCAWDIGNCDFSISMACGMTVSVTPIGDLIGISRAGLAYSQGEPVDRIDVLLSTVGLGATALALTTGGSSLSVKVGAGFLRFAHRAGSIPAPIARSLRNAADNGIDWSNLSSVRNVDDLFSVVRPDAIRPVTEAAMKLFHVVGKTSPRQGLYLFKGSESLAELKQISAVTDVLEDQTVGYFKLLGKSRVLRATLRIADEVYAIILGVLGVISSIFGLMFSTVLSVFRLQLKKWART